jgi:hypothetical protein
LEYNKPRQNGGSQKTAKHKISPEVIAYYFLL